MGMNYIDAGMLKNAFLAGAKGLEAKKEWINELNVFPVPDGDTGTNMTMTIHVSSQRSGSRGESDDGGAGEERFPPVPCAAHEEIPALSFPSSSADLRKRSRRDEMSLRRVFSQTHLTVRRRPLIRQL